MIVEQIEPHSGIGRPTILCEYPAPEAALARPKPADPRVAERFELYACGVELANAFGELTDPAEQRRRFEADMDEKQRLYGERYPIDEDFLAALAHMPPASGVALGFDRLVMLATGAPRIEEVIWTPVADVDRMNSHERCPTPPRCRPIWWRRASRRPPIAPALEAVAARYAVAMTPALAALIDPPTPPIRSPGSSCPTEAELSTRAGERADPIGDRRASARSPASCTAIPTGCC